MTQQASIGSVNQDGLSGWWRAYPRHRYAVLFYSLLLTLVVSPILIAVGMTGNLLQAFVGLNLLAAAPLVESRKWAGFCRRFCWPPSCSGLGPCRPATLATVGYGDFVPGNDVVRGLAIVEAIAGQFYLAVMIARLMSLYMREAR